MVPGNENENENLRPHSYITSNCLSVPALGPWIAPSGIDALSKIFLDTKLFILHFCSF